MTVSELIRISYNHELPLMVLLTTWNTVSACNVLNTLIAS